MKAKELRQYLDKFLKSEAAKNARDTHILNLKGVKLGGTWKMPKIIGKL